MELPRMSVTTTKDAWLVRSSSSNSVVTECYAASSMDWHEELWTEPEVLSNVERFFDEPTLRLLEAETSRTSAAVTHHENRSAQGVVVATTCSYRRGQCSNPRALKRNGTLHTLCQFHRERSCQNQRKFDAKKRSSKKKQTSVVKPNPSDAELEDMSFVADMAAIAELTSSIQQDENQLPSAFNHNVQAQSAPHELFLSL